MSSNWKSVTELAAEFGIDDKNDDILSILESLKDKRAKIHPDKNGGEFSSTAKKDEYHLLNDAVAYVEKSFENSNQLIPLSQLPVIIESITSSFANQSTGSIIEAHKNLKIELNSEISRKYLISKIVLGFLMFMSAFVFLQSGNLGNHLLLADFSNTKAFLIIVALAFNLCFLLFVYLWFKERKLQEMSNFLMGDDALQYIFYRLKKEKDSENTIVMSKVKDFLRNTDGGGFGLSSSKIQHSFKVLDRDMTDRIIELQLEKLLRRKVIKELDEIGLDKKFEVLETST